MTITSLIAFNLALLAAILSPGPALLVAIRTTLAGGRKAGIAIGFGLGLVAATWTLAALIGLDAIFSAFPWAYLTAKSLGAAYLIYIAVQMWRAARQPIEAQHTPMQHAFVQGVTINLLNPKSVVFAAAVLVVVFPPNMQLAQNVIVFANHLLIEWTFYTGLAFAMSSKAVSRRYLQAKRHLDRTASILLGTLGVRLLISR